MHERYVTGQMERIGVVLQQNPIAFRDLTINQDSGGCVFLAGVVSSREDLSLLRKDLERLFGEEVAESTGWRVTVRGSEESCCEWDQVDGWGTSALPLAP